MTNSDIYGFTSRSILGGKSLNGMREEVFRYHSVSVAGFAFQACSFNHSDISPCKWNQQFTGRAGIRAKPNCDVTVT